MNRTLRLLPFLIWGIAPACHSPTPAPFPDAAVRSGLKLKATPDSVLIRPASTKLVHFVLLDGENQPVPLHTVEFSLSTEEGVAAPAWLSSSESMTNAQGEVTLQVIAKPLSNGVENLPATLSAQTPGAAPLTMDVLVSVNNYSARIFPKADEQLLGVNSVTSMRLTLFDGASCDDINLAQLPPSSRPTRNVVPGADVLFAGLSQFRNNAVAGIGYDHTGAMRIGGCLDLPGKALQANETVRATVFLDRIFPSLLGSYNLHSQFRFATPLPATTAIRAVWQQLAYCPYDPARLWIDCTLDALSTKPTGDPLDCVPIAGNAGEIGTRILDRRGTAASPLPGLTMKSPCYDRADLKGRTSLEILVDALFANSRSALKANNLPGLPGEIETLLSTIQLDSTLLLADSGQANRYILDHSLTSVSFPTVSLARIIPITDVLAPVTRATGLIATHRREQLSIPRHDFTLRLGSVAALAFRNNSLRQRGIPTIDQLVETVFGYAQLSNNGGLLRGCAAQDVVICDAIERPRGCVYDACERGRYALMQKLRDSFLALNGAGYDFAFLSGAAPVLDIDNNGMADALGTLDQPGTWSVELQSLLGYQMFLGAWTATPTLAR